MPWIKCPVCALLLEEDDYRGQSEHMLARHPDLVAQRQAESARWDGWVND